MAKKKKSRREAPKPTPIEPIAGLSDADARAAMARALDAHIAECVPLEAHAAAAEEALLALEERESTDAARRAELRERGVDDDGWEVVTYKRKAVSAEPRAPAGQRKKVARGERNFGGEDFYKFQVKQQRLADMRRGLDETKARRHKPKRKFQS